MFVTKARVRAIVIISGKSALIVLIIFPPNLFVLFVFNYYIFLFLLPLTVY